MIKLPKPVPHETIVACSGGVDSMALVDFLKNGKKKVHLAFFHHETETSEKAFRFLLDYTNKNDLTLFFGTIKNKKQKNQSQEEFWRNERYNFLRSFNLPILTGHHLNDAVETWVFSSLHGNPKLIPYENQGVFRPLLLTPKKELYNWCIRHNVPWQEDESNKDTKYARNRIRNNIIPEALKINPGLETVIRKKLIESIK